MRCERPRFDLPGDAGGEACREGQHPDERSPLHPSVRFQSRLRHRRGWRLVSAKPGGAGSTARQSNRLLGRACRRGWSARIRIDPKDDRKALSWTAAANALQRGLIVASIRSWIPEPGPSDERTRALRRAAYPQAGGATNRALAGPILVGGAPRAIAILSGRSRPALGLQQWMPGLLVWGARHALAAVAVRPQVTYLLPKSMLCSQRLR